MEFMERAVDHIEATKSSNNEKRDRNFSGAPVAAPEGTLNSFAPQGSSAGFAIFIYFSSVILLQEKKDLKVCFSKEWPIHIVTSYK